MANNANYRELFNGIEVEVQLEGGGKKIPINFDNAATTPPLKQVDEFIYQNILMYGSVGRGGQKSSYCTNAYEVSRNEVLNFFNLTPEDGYTTIYVKNTTEGLNLLANILCDRNTHKVLTTRMEHHANDLPWRKVSQMFYCDVDKEGKIKLEDMEERLRRAQGSIKYVTVAGATNVTGYVTPIHDIARLAHKYGAKLIVDGAQLVAHRAIDIKGKSKEEAIDFLVFSGHKMYAPFGSGVIIGRQEILEKREPYLSGGSAVAAVFDDDVYYKGTPYKDEAGTPNFLGAMGIVAAMAVLKQIGFQNIREHEDHLRRQLLNGLSKIPKVILYGDKKDENRVGVIPFNIQGIHHDEIGKWLQDKRAIAVRTGCFCAQPYVMRLLGIGDAERYRYFDNPNLPRPGMIRASFGLYNTEEEIDLFLNSIEDMIRGS